MELESNKNSIIFPKYLRCKIYQFLSLNELIVKASKLSSTDRNILKNNKLLTQQMIYKIMIYDTKFDDAIKRYGYILDIVNTIKI